MPYEIKTARLQDVQMMVEWAASEGWNPGLTDAESFYAADKDGFLIGWLDGQPVSCISAVKYGSSFGFIGFYIVHPDHRGTGLGWQIWQAGMDRLSGCVIGLDGVVDQQDNYAKCGFKLVQNNIRYGGIPEATMPSTETKQVSEASPALIEYDAGFFAGPRAPFLTAWISAQESTTLVKQVQGMIQGYGTIRKCREGYKIGALFADSHEIAEELFCGLVATCPGQTVYLDVPQPNAQAVHLAQRHGLEPVFETARMYQGGLPNLPMDRTYGITSFELG